MPHFETRMGPDGTLAVPEPVRTAFNLMAGDIVDFYLDVRERTARIRARNVSISTLAGMFPTADQSAGPPLSAEDIDNAIGEHLREDDERIQRDATEWDEFLAWRRARDRAAE
jgi:bifunctional DNA-binding transcriptional regulator/antitoxin component of YhaV-PrlF toxin-antitoxin module